MPCRPLLPPSLLRARPAPQPGEGGGRAESGAEGGYGPVKIKDHIHASIYQGKPFWGYPIFDNRSHMLEGTSAD